MTGTFTVPPGGDGYYYFSTLVYDDKSGRFEIRINGLSLCTAQTDQTEVFLNGAELSANSGNLIIIEA